MDYADGIFWARLALIMVGGDATLDECNDFIKRYYRDVELTSRDIERYREALQHEEPGKRLVSKALRRKADVRYLLTSPEGRQAVLCGVANSFSPSEVLEALGLRLSVSVDFSKHPAKTTSRLRCKKLPDKVGKRPAKQNGPNKRQNLKDQS